MQACFYESALTACLLSLLAGRCLHIQHMGRLSLVRQSTERIYMATEHPIRCSHRHMSQAKINGELLPIAVHSNGLNGLSPVLGLPDYLTLDKAGAPWA